MGTRIVFVTVINLYMINLISKKTLWFLLHEEVVSIVIKVFLAPGNL